MTYTIETKGDGFLLRGIRQKDRNHTIIVNSKHPQFQMVKGAYTANALVKINTTTNKWKVANGTPYTETPSSVVDEPLKPTSPLKLVKLNIKDISDKLFEIMQTGTIFDSFISSTGGLLYATNLMVAGEPGVGKTTLLLEMISKLNTSGRKCAFISGEMTRIGMLRYLVRFPHWKNIPVLFLDEIDDRSIKTAIEEFMDMSWDVVLTDSYTEVNDSVKEEEGMTSKGAEKWFLTLMKRHNNAENKEKRHTSFCTILQLTKGGNFVGSNKLKHMTDSMMNMKFDTENGGRYMVFSKNRIGEVGNKLYYSLNGGVSFETSRYEMDLRAVKLAQENSEADSISEVWGASNFGDN